MPEKYSDNALARRNNILNEAEYEFLINFDDTQLFEDTVVDAYYDDCNKNDLLLDKIANIIIESGILQSQPSWILCANIYDIVKEYELGRVVGEWLDKNKKI